MTSDTPTPPAPDDPGPDHEPVDGPRGEPVGRPGPGPGPDHGGDQATGPPPSHDTGSTDDARDAPTRNMDPVTPPPPEPPPPAGLYRSETDRMLAGVCGGIAERYGFEAVLVRLVFIATLFIGGAGILFYIAAAIVIPRQPLAADGTPLTNGDSSTAASVGNNVLRVLVGLAVGLAILCGLFVVAGLSFGTTVLFGAWPMAIMITLLGVLVAVNARSRRTTGTLLVLILALALPAAATVIADVRVDRSAGDRTERPVTIADATEGYRLGMGQLTVDLRDLPAGDAGASTTIPVRLDIGRANLVIPDDRCVAWTIRTRIRVGGDVRVLDQGRESTWVGNDQRRTFQIDPSSSGRRPHVTVDVEVGAGEIVVVNSLRDLDHLPDDTTGNRSVIRTDACRPAGATRP